MTITVTLSDANNDGIGINLDAYFASFESSFTPSGYGQFSGANRISGEQYALTDQAGYGVIMTSGATDWAYSMSTHTVGGSIDTLAFGSNTTLNQTTHLFTQTTDVLISGLGIEDSTGANLIRADLTNKSTDEVINALKGDALVFNGSSGADTLQGYGFNDVLNGNGGNDTLLGGAGNDTLKGGDGIDKLSGDTGNDTLYGNDGNDTLYGNDGNDTLHGGAGNDTVKGGAGIDTLYGESGNDLIYGSAGADTLYGSSGNDTLYGGTDVDTLYGGTGSDSFVFETTFGSANIDKVKDFEVRYDTIQLDDDVFKKVGAIGDLAASAFTIGTQALDASDRIIYNKSTGALYYDADGNGSGAAVQFATLGTNLALTASNFDIIA